MTDPTLASWPDRLGKVITGECRILKRVHVLNETDSTQDAARRMNAQPGDIIIVGRQRAGRGRHGKTWADTGDEGIAVSIVVDRKQSEHLAIAAAVGAAHGIESILERQIHIKWPNDIMVENRKLAGILIEQVDQRAIIGIGINVAQSSWPNELQGIAVSLAQLGITVDRLNVLAALLPAVDHALQLDRDELNRMFLERDCLCGCVVQCLNARQTVKGTITAIDPMCGLSIRTVEGERWLDAATTTMVRIMTAAETESQGSIS